MSYRKVYNDRNYDHVSKNFSDKIPRARSTGSIGNEPGMIGNIILNRDSKQLCYHDGSEWNCIETSQESAVCVNGQYQGTTNVPAETFVNIISGTGDTVGFIGPTDANWEWAVSAGGQFSTEGYGITTDKCGNSYITGYFTGSTQFYDKNGTVVITLTAGTSPPTLVQNIYVAKISSSGEWQWAVKAGGTSDDRGRSIAVDAYGNAYVTGNFTGLVGFYNNGALAAEIILDSGASPVTDDLDIFVAKINSDGIWEWAAKAGAISYDEGYGISVSKCGTAYVTGYFQKTIGFYNVNAGVASIIMNSTTSTQDDIFVAKINNSGYWEWAVKAGGVFGDYGYSVSIDDCENAYIAGYIIGSVGFYNYGSLVPQLMLGSPEEASRSLCVAKINTNGIWSWAVRGNGAGFSYGTGVSVNSDGSVCVVGYYQRDVGFYDKNADSPTIILTAINNVQDAYVAKINSSGYWQWAAKIGGTLSDQGLAIKTDECGNSHVTGYFRNTAGFYNSGSLVSDISLTALGNTDIVVAKINPVGDWIWAIKAGYTLDDQGTSVSVDNYGNVYVTGLFRTKAEFYNNEGEIASITLDSAQGNTAANMFVGKINSYICSKKPKTLVSLPVNESGDIATLCFTDGELLNYLGVIPGSYYVLNSDGQLVETTCYKEAGYAGVTNTQMISLFNDK